MKAIAVDDEPMALEVIRSLADKAPLVELKATFTDALQAIEYLQQQPVDLLFLDIKMPDISGIDFLKSLNNKPLVIFTTAYTEHAVTSFELDAVDYLLKPFSLVRFIKACNKASELYRLRKKGEEKDHLFLKTGYEQVKVLLGEINYLEAAGNYVSFVTEHEKVMSRMTINEAETLLPAEMFVRTHRSYIIAVKKVTKVERHQVHLKSHIIPIGSSYANRLDAHLTD